MRYHNETHTCLFYIEQWQFVASGFEHFFRSLSSMATDRLISNDGAMAYAVGAASQQRRIAARCRPTPPQCNRRRRRHWRLPTVCSAVLNHRRGWARVKNSPPHAPVGADVRLYVAHPRRTMRCSVECGRACAHPPDALRRAASEKRIPPRSSALQRPTRNPPS